ncbi:MAG TPA: hypothetical protein VER96_17560 [Polyangiaceae bacterium]|nr:hypothetical protein [Polyangiaceae bacterium]
MKCSLGCWIATLVVLAAPGCGSSTATGPSADLVTLRDQLLHAVCDNMGACCSAAAIHFDQATCQLNAAARIDFLLSPGKYPGVEYDSGAGARCVAAYESLLETCSPITVEALNACATLFTGTIPLGSACSSTAQCAPVSPGEGVYCTSRDGGPTVCTAFPTAHAQLGARCGGTCDNPDHCSSSSANTICFLEDGLECDPLTSKCKKPAALGEECGPGQSQCAIDAFCNERYVCEAPRASGSCQSSEVKCSTASYCKSGQCSPKEVDGTPCIYPEECGSSYCDLSSGTGHCAVYVRKLATADTCIGQVL